MALADLGAPKDLVKACSLDELRRAGNKVIAVGGRAIVVFYDEGQVYALDNRCPHMGFPLHRGTVRNGVLICHWHHAKFDLAGGCTFDPFADDITPFHAEVREGVVYVDPRPMEADRREHWDRKLDEGLQQQIPLVLAKSVIGLDSLGQTGDILRRAALFGVHNRASGWSTGLSIMTAMHNVLPYLEAADRPLALYHGLSAVAGSTAGEAPAFPLAPLNTRETKPGRFQEWFRHSVEVRAGSGAERALRTAIASGQSKDLIAEMVFAAATDHRYLDGGHTLDFANKAFELLEQIGWQHAQDVLPSLVPHLVGGQRMEETSAWRDPLDLGALLDAVDADLRLALHRSDGSKIEWRGHRTLAEQVLDGTPTETMETMVRLIAAGVPLTELSATIAYAAARRLAHFHTSNEFFDWDTAHHAFTYANAVDQALRRSPSPLLARGIFDAAAAIYLERFLNIPKQPLPVFTGSTPAPAEVLSSFDRQGQVNETARLLAGLLTDSDVSGAVRLLGHALLREDAGFHQFQSFEAAVRQAFNHRDPALRSDILVGVCRFLSTHSPTTRASGQTFEVAARLHRGEALHGDV